MFASQGQSMMISARENAMHDLQCKVPTPHRNLVTSVRQIRAFGLPHTARPSHKERLAVIFEHEASSNTCASKSRCLLGDKTPSPHCQWASPLSWLGRGVVRRNGQSPQIHVETPGAAVRGRAGSLSRRIDRKLLGRPTAVPCGLSGCVRRAGNIRLAKLWCCFQVPRHREERHAAQLSWIESLAHALNSCIKLLRALFRTLWFDAYVVVANENMSTSRTIY